MEKGKLVVLRGTDAEEPVPSSAWLAGFSDLQVHKGWNWHAATDSIHGPAIVAVFAADECPCQLRPVCKSVGCTVIHMHSTCSVHLAVDCLLCVACVLIWQNTT
jgi:hypothetical protein